METQHRFIRTEPLEALSDLLKADSTDPNFALYRYSTVSVTMYALMRVLLAIFIIIHIYELVKMLNDWTVQAVIVLVLLCFAVLSNVVLSGFKAANNYGVLCIFLDRSPPSTPTSPMVLSTVELILENACMWLFVISVQIYVVLLAVLCQDPVYPLSRRENSYGMLRMIVLMLVFTPVIMVMVMKRISIRGALLAMLLVLTVNLAVFIYCHALFDGCRFVMQFSFAFYIFTEQARQLWHSFVTTQHLVSSAKENKMLSEEVRANELRHLIGNVAHDLKTVSG
jgi:hypothetical protein